MHKTAMEQATDSKEANRRKNLASLPCLGAIKCNRPANKSTTTPRTTIES